MRTLRKADERGHINMGWLDTYHTFSFSDYYDPNWIHFRGLRVMNEDRVAAGQGFGMHPHRDMEIITIILSGSLQHRDSMGNTAVIRPGEVQRMTAGTGVFHSEFNPSPDDPVHLYQIWIFPREKGSTPSYEQKEFDLGAMKNRLVLTASPDGAEVSVTIGADAKLYRSILAKGSTLEVPIAPGRAVWLQTVSGTLETGTHTLGAGDGLGITDESSLTISASDDAELLLFDLA